MSVKSYLSFFFILVQAFATYGQAGRVVKKYNVKDGLSQGIVTSITQDDKGLMWFATEDGLNRFDGYSFSVFKYTPDNRARTVDNFVQHVFKDAEGNIWSSSRSGLYHFDHSREQFHAYPYNAPSFVNDITFIREGKNKNLWIAWYVRGFASFNKYTKQYTAYTSETLPSLTTNASITLHEDSFGLLWVGSQNDGLNVYQVKDGKVLNKREDLSDKSILPSFYVKCIAEDHNGNIWIGTTKGLVVYLRSVDKFHVFNASDHPVQNKGVFSLLTDSQQVLWIGTQGEGVYKLNLRNFNVNDPAFEHIDVLERYNVSRHTVRALYEDSDKNIWMGTHGDGIYMISSTNKNFVSFHQKHYIKSAESFVQFYGMCNDKAGNLWLGTDGDGLYKMNLQGDVLHHYTADGKRGSLTDDAILSAHKDHEGNLWFGSYAHGLFLYHEETGEFQNFNHAASDSTGHMGNQVRLIYEDSKRNIWIGASRGGLCLVNKGEGVFRNFSKTGVLKRMDVRAMVEDKAGNLWIGGYGDGLYYFFPQTGDVKRFLYESEERNLLKSNVISALAMDAEDRLWIGTGGGGLSVYNPIKDSLVRFSEQNGLINNTIHAIQIDAAGMVWMSTNKGISKFDPESQQFVNYNSFDGLQEGQFNPGSSLFNQDEAYMCFGGAQGASIFYPEKVVENVKIPEVMISGFQLFNKPVAVSSPHNEGNGILPKAISETKEIVLQHDQAVITFEFVALNYSFPEKNQYAYKLEGLDRDWNYVGNQRTATYRYLSPGNYVFKVKATNQDNVWPGKHARVELVILPPFWKTPGAYLLYFIVVGSIVVGAVVVRRKQLSLSKRLRIEKAQRKRDRQMVREKLSFFTGVSHEFRTPLTLIIGPLEEMLTREGMLTPTGRKLKMVHRNAYKLLRLVNMLLDYRKAESGNMVLKVREDNIVHFIEEIFITFKELALRKNIDFQLCSDEAQIPVWFDKEKLEMVLNNVLSNSFKYIGKGNAISIKVEKIGSSDDGKVSIAICDNGIGIPQNQLKYIFDWFYLGNNATPVSSGIGLALAKKLVHLHKGEILVNSTTDGTMFTIHIPLGKKHFNKHDILSSEEEEMVVPVNDTFEEAADDDAQIKTSSRKKGLKNILIVEDDLEIRSFLKDYLKQDYKIWEAGNGREALEISENHYIDLIVSDIMMPEMNGIDFCKQLKQNIRTSHIPIILLTAKTSLTHHKEGLEIGADAYLTKPFSPEILTITINNLFQSRENLKRFYRTLFTANEVEKKDVVSPDEKFLYKIEELLKSNLETPEFNLNDLCDGLNMSRSLLYKKIKILTGLSPVEYLRSLRLQEAAQLLKSQQYKVFEVMYMVGFTDAKYFRQCFTKEFGYPPSELLEK